MKVIRVLIVDDHQIVREGLQTLLGEEKEFERHYFSNALKIYSGNG